MSGSNATRTRRFWRGGLGVPWTTAALLTWAIGCGGKYPSSWYENSEAHIASAAHSSSAVARMVDLGQAQANEWLGLSRAGALRNMLGGARGIFVAPDIGGASLPEGVAAGTGLLMRRHGEDWSDPVFFTLTQSSAATQPGANNSPVILLLMTDNAIEDFVNGHLKVGDSGGITIDACDLSVAGATGANGELEARIVSSSHEAWPGNGVAILPPKPAADLNAQAYGPRADLNAILAKPGGKFAHARSFRRDMTRMVRQAWDLRSAASPAVAENAGK